MTDTRPPIIAEYANGMRKLFCPCTAVLVWNPAVSDAPPAQCAFCKRRYEWSEPARDSGANDTGKGASIPSDLRKCATASTLESRAGPIPYDESDLAEWRRTFMKAGRQVHEAPTRIPILPPLGTDCSESLPLRSMRPPGGGPTTAPRAGCEHSPEQIGGRRCVRCCTERGLSYVWRNAAGGASGGYRWLCAPCRGAYEGLGLVGGRRTHVNGYINSGYGEPVAGEVGAR